jgi:hypothetical protein
MPLPHPIANSLSAQLDKTLTTIPAGGTGQASITASLKGIEAEVATRIKWGWELGVWGAAERGVGSEAGIRLRKQW